MISAIFKAIREALPLRRKQYIINPRLQLTMIGFNIGLAALLLVAFYGENVYLFSKFVEVQSAELAQDPIIAEMIAEEQARLRTVFSITAVVVMAFMAIGGLILSNRIAGPIYRLQKHLEMLKKGETDRKIAFREKDFFKELADSFNEYQQDQLMAKSEQKQDVREAS